MRRILVATAATIALSGAAFAQQGPFNAGGFADSGSTGTFTGTRSSPTYSAAGQHRMMFSSNHPAISTNGGVRAGVGSSLNAGGTGSQLGNMATN